MLQNKKNVFWQAFFLTLMFFFLGIVLGIYLEQSRADNINVAFYNSEASLYDSFALGQLVQDESASCDLIKKATLDFTDKIYDEARELEKFDESNQLTESIKTIHRKYDLLRTLLWMNIIELKKKCDLNTAVYLYVYDSDDIELKAKQVVWSRILQELKEDKGSDVVLIPIAVDQDVTSLDYLIGKYGVKEFPAVIINEKDIFYEHKTARELAGYLEQ